MRFFDAGGSGIQAIVCKGEAIVIDAQLVQDGRVDVAHMNRIFYDIVAEVIGLAVNYTFLDSATCHPHGETTRMMIPAIVVAG